MLQQEERAVVETVLWFANLKRVRKTSQIENRFALLSAGWFQIIPPAEVETYRKGQEHLQERLKAISGSERGRREIETWVNKQLAEKVNARLVFIHGELRPKFWIDGIEAACALGLALILDERHGLRTRLKQCGNPGCKRFNLDLDPRGRPRSHCDSACGQEADRATGPERQRRYRAKHR